MSFKRVKVVMLPTNEKSKLVLSYCNELAINWTHDLAKFDDATYQNLYFLSDEEIKEGDWYLTFQNDKLIGGPRKCEDSSYSFIYCKKIIATTDKSLTVKSFINYGKESGKEVDVLLPQPSQSFIEKYVEEYNKGNIITEVMVEYFNNVPAISNEEYEALEKEKISYKDTKPFYIDVLKINPKDNTITIRKTKDSWNREEVIELCRKAMICDTHYDGFIHPLFDQWIEENL